MNNIIHKEIEAKAHVKSSYVELLKKVLTVRYGNSKKESKSDLYFHDVDGDFRIRKCEEKYVYTKKHQSMCGGVEVNDESEYILNLTEVANYKELHHPFLEKSKTGYIWSVDTKIDEMFSTMNIELVSVEGKYENKPYKELGWFLEVEVLIGNANDTLINSARNFIETFFKDLNLNDSIEKKKYMAMLEVE